MMRVFLLLGILLSATGYAESPIVGHWFYFQKIYKGIPYPEPPEATLRLHFEFSASGDSRLYWWREGDSRFCERKGKYHVIENILVDQVVWVNPKNGNDCAQDPDMQLGKITRTPISFESGNFHLHLPLGDEDLIYVWKKM